MQIKDHDWLVKEFRKVRDTGAILELSDHFEMSAMVGATIAIQAMRDGMKDGDILNWIQLRTQHIANACKKAKT